jgi:hypothetical protein
MSRLGKDYINYNLRGTIKSADGGGAGEGGDLPPYESDVLYVVF